MLADETAPKARASDLPLVVDLDGTLIRSDVFADAMLRYGFREPWKAPLLLGWLAHCLSSRSTAGQHG